MKLKDILNEIELDTKALDAIDIPGTNQVGLPQQAIRKIDYAVATFQKETKMHVNSKTATKADFKYNLETYLKSLAKALAILDKSLEQDCIGRLEHNFDKILKSRLTISMVLNAVIKDNKKVSEEEKEKITDLIKGKMNDIDTLHLFKAGYKEAKE